jgi:serine/threonine-protein kinase TTK/MPS1
MLMCACGYQMLQAVQVIHEEKIVHSDLKPANFVLVRGQLKLIDFGIANAIANDTTNIQRDHQVCLHAASTCVAFFLADPIPFTLQIGTVNYMSPETIELPDGMRRLKVGRPSDVWSLGCILYQMVYGHPPFQHLSVYQKMKAIPDTTHEIEFPEFATPMVRSGSTGSPPKKLDHLRRRVPTCVIACMKKCLERNPKERVTIPELLEQEWLGMKEEGALSGLTLLFSALYTDRWYYPSVGLGEPPVPEPPRKPELAEDETIINPYYMRQLLQYGIRLGQQQNSADMSPEDLLREATVRLLILISLCLCEILIRVIDD